MIGTRYTLEVNPTLPDRLKRLTELANDLFYSWDRDVRGLFYSLDGALWESCGHNPRVFLRRVAQQILDRAADDRAFLEEYNQVLSAYDSYRKSKPAPALRELLDPNRDLVAYFCAEFGFHESVQLYSGGLGILAGDHCKAASDLGIPFVAVGILYRQGYYTQTIDAQGNQIAHYYPTQFEDLPIAPATDDKGNEIHVHVDLPGRRVLLRVWKAVAGHVNLYLLDSDLSENTEVDRRITHQLYGGDRSTRIQQEIVLGIGGVRAVNAVGLKPTVWHCNEGHPAFMILERCRELVASGVTFDAALEAVAGNTVFTMHTPVAAGHDIFDNSLMAGYFNEFVKQLGISPEQFLALGSSPSSEGGFNMTALGLRGSRFRNGVSRIHGGVAASMSSYQWPQIPPEENPVGYVTNGVHVPTFLAREWVNLFDTRVGTGWHNELLNTEFWERQVEDIPNHHYWNVLQSLKTDMLAEVCQRVMKRERRNGTSEAAIERLTKFLRSRSHDILALGFARRFATYKRANLLFAEPERLARLLTNPERPCLVIFAGKAHPHDLPAQQLIRMIHEYSHRPDFQGHLILLEGYDLAIARKLVSGVDVWLNTPEYPLEASGTSGQKAALNGVLNLSVLDGWWGEGYNGQNGWAITPHGPKYDPAYRDNEEADELLDILEKQVIPLYYGRNGSGYSQGWVEMSKASMKSILPRFNSQRMVMDYVNHYYAPARRQHQVLIGNNHQRARELADWRKKIEHLWPKVRLRILDTPPTQLPSGATATLRVAAYLDGLNADDVLVECLMGTESDTNDLHVLDQHVFKPLSKNDGGETIFTLDLAPRLPGLQYYKIRMYPFHPALAHRLEMGCMVWL
ncbi:MAG TPA: alpha-glucan family phosphorylase [Burkholderiales bacterium]|nr:alpha-glucan family phosphorylase [Burkholderiales bacterium]